MPMNSESIAKEITSLIESTREHLCYLRELGVESCETNAGSAARKVADETEPETRSTARTGVANNFAAPEITVRSAPVTVKPAPKSVSKPAATETLFADAFQKQPDLLPESNETFEAIWQEIGDCTRCPLAEGRTNVVHTEGNRRARLMFVGEAPGADEDLQSRPFVGRAGQLLTKIIEAIGMKREEVLIGNVNRCRPPGNRPPTFEEASQCKPFLLREIAAARPEVIVVLGNTAMKNLLDTKEGITRVRGRFQDFKGIKVMPTFHPAYLLRDPSKKRETWDDLKKVRDYLDSTPRQEE